MPLPMQKSREITFQILYGLDIAKCSDENMLELMTNELKVTKKTVKEIQIRVHQINSRLIEIDSLISSTSKSYEFDRIQSVERNILRLGVFEILYDETIPPKVAIAEALRLAKKFSTKESALFINAILDAIYKLSVGEKSDLSQIQQASLELSEIEEISKEASTAPKEQFTSENNL